MQSAYTYFFDKRKHHGYGKRVWACTLPGVSCYYSGADPPSNTSTLIDRLVA